LTSVGQNSDRFATYSYSDGYTSLLYEFYHDNTFTCDWSDGCVGKRIAGFWTIFADTITFEGDIKGVYKSVDDIIDPKIIVSYDGLFTLGKTKKGEYFRNKELVSGNIFMLIDSLQFITDMPYICETGQHGFGCGDSIFWRTVQYKQAIIPLLIGKLTDTTITQATVPNLGGQWTVADIAYTALQEIIKDFPTFELLGVPFDTNGCGYCAYWQHLRKDRRNRFLFQSAVDHWYHAYKTHLVWVTSNEFLTCDCHGQHPNGGHFELDK